MAGWLVAEQGLRRRHVEIVDGKCLGKLWSSNVAKQLGEHDLKLAPEAMEFISLGSQRYFNVPSRVGQTNTTYRANAHEAVWTDSWGHVVSQRVPLSNLLSGRHR